MSQYARQSFLGEDSEAILENATIGIIGCGGGGSHVAQQAAHIGFGNYVTIDPDVIEDTNLNRLIGGMVDDVKNSMHKVDIIERLILGLKPTANIIKKQDEWQDYSDYLKHCDVIIGCLDTVLAKDELEKFCRRYLIPYIDIGMDVHSISSGFLISGQVVLSVPGSHCLRCYGVVTDQTLEAEAANYGDAGGRPQVVWPNAVLASSAVGLAMQLLTPWHDQPVESMYLEYDGNLNTIKISEKMKFIQNRGCSHYLNIETGDPSFDIRKALPAQKALLDTTDQRSGVMAWFCSLVGKFNVFH